MSPIDLQTRKGQANAKLQIAYDEGKDGFALSEETLKSSMASLSLEGRDTSEIEGNGKDKKDYDDYMFFRIDNLNFNGKRKRYTVVFYF